VNVVMLNVVMLSIALLSVVSSAPPSVKLLTKVGRGPHSNLVEKVQRHYTKCC
jgi:hypothetical protein